MNCWYNNIAEFALKSSQVKILTKLSTLQVMMDVVELDSEMVSVAEKWFGFSQGKNIKVFIDDGIHFIKEACSRKKGYYW